MPSRPRRSVLRTARAGAPLTIRLPEALRRRTERYARTRNLQLSGAIRGILSQHLDELDEDAQLTRAERWQRDQAWATARTILEGTAEETTWEEIRAAAVAAAARTRRIGSAR